MNHIGNFFVYMLVALIVFVFVLLFTLRKRLKQPVFKIVLQDRIIIHYCCCWRHDICKNYLWERRAMVDILCNSCIYNLCFATNCPKHDKT